MLQKLLLSSLVALTLFSSSFFVNAAESKTVILNVPGMTCKFCPITIRKALKKLPGVTDAKADYDTKTATVTFDPDKTNVEALTKATANAGYPSTLKK